MEKLDPENRYGAAAGRAGCGIVLAFAAALVLPAATARGQSAPNLFVIPVTGDAAADSGADPARLGAVSVRTNASGAAGNGAPIVVAAPPSKVSAAVGAKEGNSRS